MEAEQAGVNREPAEGSRAARMRATLEAAFAPAELEIRNESWRHAGHGPYTGAGETHFFVRVVSPAFQGLRTLEQHRRVNAALAQEFADGLHALQLETAAPAAQDS